MTDYQLNKIDPDDIKDLLIKVASSFDIKFMDDELMHCTTSEQLIGHIVGKIQLDHSDSCTSQQAFYKLRDAISTPFNIHRDMIATDTRLTDLFPRHNRRAQVKVLEEQLGFKLNILRAPQWVTAMLTFLILGSFVALFFNKPIGFCGLMCSFVGVRFSHQLGNTFELQTLGQVAKKMTRENYLKSRRNPKTVNKNEVTKLLTNWFYNDLGLGKNTR